MVYHSQGSTLAPPHSTPLDPLTPLYMLLPSPNLPSPPSSCSASTSTSASNSTSDSNSQSVARASAASSFAVFKSIPFWSHHRRDIHNWSRINVMCDCVLPPCDAFTDLFKPRLSHGLPQIGIVPFPIPHSPLLSPRDPALSPVHETLQ